MPEFKYYEEYLLGEKVKTSGRTMTDSDIRMFIGCSGSTHRLHIDKEYCAKHPIVHDCIVQGVLILAVADGLLSLEVTPNKGHTMHYGHDKVRYLKPVYPGDTIHIETEIVEKKIRNDEFGVITWNVYVVNQDGEKVLFHIDKQLIGRIGKTHKNDEEDPRSLEEIWQGVTDNGSEEVA